LKAPGRQRQASGLFERHLDLAPLKGRRHGLVRCIFHGPDSTPSFSVHLDRGLFHCFACGVGGGRARVAELVGVEAPHADGPRGAPNIVALARRQAWAKPGILESYRGSDAVRRRLQWAARLRRTASRLSHDATWETLAEAARVDRLALNLDAALDHAIDDRRDKPRWAAPREREAQSGAGNVPALAVTAGVRGTGDCRRDQGARRGG